MNPAQIHLALNHLPVFLTLFAVPALIISLIKNSRSYLHLSWILLMAGALSSVPVFLSGEPTEELVEHSPGVSESLIHNHEEAAELAMGFTAILGVMSLFFFIWESTGKTISKTLIVGLLVFTTLASILFLRTAHLGGMIRHEEIRGNAQIGSSQEFESHSEKEDD